MKLVIGVLIAICIATAIQPSQAAELAAPVAACIRDNAPKVEQAIQSLSEAVEFLTVDICANEINAEAQRQWTEDQRTSQQRMKELCNNLRNNRPTAHDDSERVGLMCDPTLTEIGYQGGWAMYSSGVKPAAAVALASKVLLDLRLARMARESHH